MPPEVSNGPRRAGRPARAAEPVPEPVAPTVRAKRGRPAKAEAADIAAEPPKKRGRPAKVTAEIPGPLDTKALKRGRPSLRAPETVADAPTPKASARASRTHQAETEATDPAVTKKRAGRPRKDDAVPDVAPASGKRGRPARTASRDLRGVAGSPRISKRTVGRPAHTFSRLDPRVRSKLRTRLPPAPKVVKQESAAAPAKRGRPRKATVEAPKPKKAEALKVQKAKASKPVKAEASKSKKLAAQQTTNATSSKPAKSIVPRKRRGFTTLEVADSYAAQVKQYYAGLLAASATARAVSVEEDQAQVLDADVDAEVPDEDAVEDELDVTIAENTIPVEDEGVEVDENDDDNVEGDERDNSNNVNIEMPGDAQEIASEGVEVTNVDAPAEDVVEEALADNTVLEDDFEGDVQEQSSDRAQELDVEMNIQETVQVEQDLDGNITLEQAINSELVLPEEPLLEAPSLFAPGGLDEFVHDSSRHSAATIFG